MRPHRQTALVLGAALLAAVAFAVWVSVRAFMPNSGVGGMVVVGALVAGGVCTRAAFRLFQLEHGRTETWRAVAWFVGGCLSLAFLLVTVGLTHMTG